MVERSVAATSRTAESSNGLGGWSMAVFAFSLIGWFGLQVAGRGPDPDHARISMEYLTNHSRSYVVAGLLMWVMALSLTTVVTVVSDVMAPRVASTQRRVAAAVGYFSAAFFLLYGALLVSTPGTLEYMGDLDRAWGEAAYLAVQIIGSQGMATGGLLAFSAWAAWLGFANARAKTLNRAVTVLALSPVLLILMGILGPLAVGPDALYLVYVVAFIGLAPWCLTVAVSLTRAKPHQVKSPPALDPGSA